jgi:ribosomal protein L37E
MHRFNLIENANDSLEHAIQHMGPINQNGAGDWKRIIVDFAHVIELLFKEKLRQTHPAFVLENIDKYPSNDPLTVGAEKALKRLQNICNIKFSIKEISAINAAREKRNKIEHFEFSISEHEAKALVGQVLSFILDFADEHLNLDWKASHLKDGKWWIFRQYTEFYEDLLCKAKKKISSEGTYVIKCTSCHNETFDVDEEKCLVCGHSEDVLECKWCKEPYIFSSCEYSEEARLCPGCEWKDGHAAANCEKY